MSKYRKTEASDSLPPVYLPSAKNPKRPTIAELWSAIVLIKRELRAMEDKYDETMAGKYEALLDRVESMCSDVDDVDNKVSDVVDMAQSLEARLDDVERAKEEQSK